MLSREQKDRAREERSHQQRIDNELLQKAIDEELQRKQDEASYEAHRAAEYRDWEQWEVLNGKPEPIKRRRLLVTARHCKPHPVGQGEDVDYRHPE